MKQVMNSLETYRLQIDAIDNEIVELLNERMQIASKIGEIKNQAAISIRDKDREKFILSRVSTLVNSVPLKECIEKIYELIFEASRGSQPHK